MSSIDFTCSSADTENIRIETPTGNLSDLLLNGTFQAQFKLDEVYCQQKDETAMAFGIASGWYTPVIGCEVEKLAVVNDLPQIIDLPIRTPDL